MLKFNIEFFDAIVYSPCADARLARYIRGFEVSHIPPLERRRLSSAAKCAFDLTKNLDISAMPIVFSSYEGEINRCFELQNDMARGEPLSPTSFSLSVHNGISSLLSIGSKNRCEILALSAYAPLEYALLQASLHLEDGFEKVLVLAYHESISQEYFNQNQPSFMTALVVSKGENLTLSQHEKDGDEDQNSLLKFLLNFNPNEKCRWQINDKSSTWRWQYEPKADI